MNGFDTSSPSTTYYEYDLRNRMIAVDANGDDLTFDSVTGNTSGTVHDSVDATYGYDDQDVRISETTGGTSSFFLNDPNNPTGYSQTLEKKTGTSIANATLNTSYILGQRVEGQQDSTGVVYFIRDGHGSVRLLTDSSGHAVSGTNYDYTAFGDPIGFNPATARTTQLFGGDGVYDPASGFSYHLARWRDGFFFTQMDSYSGDNEDPLSLHRYLYAEGNPISQDDPSGHITTADLAAAGGIAAGLDAEINPLLSEMDEVLQERRFKSSIPCNGYLLASIVKNAARNYEGLPAFVRGCFVDWRSSWQEFCAFFQSSVEGGIESEVAAMRLVG